MVHTATPDPEKEALWRQCVAQQAASGLTVRDWCRQAGYSDSLFHYWKSNLARRDGTYTPPLRRAPSSPKPARPRPPKPAPAFAQVVLKAPQPKPEATPGATATGATTMPAAALELVLPGERVVRVREGFDPATLARLLAVLEARPC